MSDPTQNPRPGESGSQPPGGASDQPRPPGEPSPSGEPAPPPEQPGPPPGETSQPPGTWASQPPPPGQGSYGTAPPPPGGWQPQGGWQQPGPYPPQGAPAGYGQPAELLPRFVARLLDFILVGFVGGLIGAVVFAIVAAGTGGIVATTGWGFPTGRASYVANAIGSVIGAALYLGYFTLMEAKLGQTLGKMVMKLQTRGPGGGRPTMEQALKRNAWVAIRVLGVLPFVGWIGGLLWLVAVIGIAVTIANNTTTRQGWHDQFAGGTTVVRLG